jgi:hypothetical protein
MPQVDQEKTTNDAVVARRRKNAERHGVRQISQLSRLHIHMQTFSTWLKQIPAGRSRGQQQPTAGANGQTKGGRIAQGARGNLDSGRRSRLALLALLQAYPPGSDTYEPKKDDVPIHQLGYRSSYLA